MNTQQRLLFQAVKSDSKFCSGMHESLRLRFHLHRWIAVIFALLLISCASLTPERVQVLAAIAGQAAQQGAQEWLKAHPDQRPAFNLVMQAIDNFIRAGNTNMAEYTALLESLPTPTLRGTAGEVYVTGTPKTNVVETAHLVIWDAELKKAVPVAGALEKPVMKSVRDGLKRAMAPVPPPLPRFENATRAVRMPAVPSEIHVTNIIVHHWVYVTNTVTVEPTLPQLGVTPEGTGTDAALDAEFKAYLAAKAKTNAGPRKVRIFRPGSPDGYPTNVVK